jgi:hypothetical protein
MFCLVRGRISHVPKPSSKPQCHWTKKCRNRNVQRTRVGQSSLLDVVGVRTQGIASSVIVNGLLRALESAICLFLGATLLLIPLLDAKEPLSQEVGIVLKLKGEWLLDGKPVVAGETLPAAGKIYHPPPKAGAPASMDYISVVFFDGTIESRSWDKAESWNSPIQLPAVRKEAPSRWSRIVNAVMGIFPGHPEKYTQMSVRGPATNIQDAVVDLNNGQLDLGPVFKHLKKGKYLIVLEPIQHTNTLTEKATSKPISFNWDPNTSPALWVDGIRPGLYSLRIQNAQSEDTSGNRSEAWILVSDHARYERTAAAFQECTALTETWASEAPADAAWSFRRAYLDSLALQENR